MATFRLRRFSCPEILKGVAPQRLIAFLEPQRRFFTSRGFAMPPPGSTEELDFKGLIEIFMSPDVKTPKELIDALFFVDEMATTEGMDSLLAEATRQRLKLDPGTDHSPADVAVQVWLLDKDLLERKHAEQFLVKPRSFESYQTDRSPVPPFKPPTAAQLRNLEQALDDWFEQKQRGRGARVFPYTRDDGVWFLVRHGEPFKREESLDGTEPSSVCYRPSKYDVLVYLPAIGEVRINARSKGEKQLYCAQFGKHLFADENFFPGTNKYTLDPLRESGEASLRCADVKGLEWIKLKEVHLYWGGPQSEVEIRKADDVFAALKGRNRSLPETARLIRAVFQVKFTDSKTPRSVTIRPSNIAQFTRDSDAEQVEEWLDKRGFIISKAVEEHETARAAMASA